MNQRKIQFTPVWDSEPSEETPSVGPRFWTYYFWRRFPFSTWISIALLLLLLSCILFLVAFLTNGWGVLIVRNVDKVNGTVAEPEEWWEFGLWQCCRNDGFCLGTRWPAFYGAARGFAVLGLFFHILTFAWMLGHQLEKLLDYDICTMSTLIALCFISGLSCAGDLLSLMFLLKEDLSQVIGHEDELIPDGAPVFIKIQGSQYKPPAPVSVYVDGKKFGETKSIMMAFAYIISGIYVFNMTYPETLTKTFIFFEKVAFKLKDTSTQTRKRKKDEQAVTSFVTRLNAEVTAKKVKNINKSR